MEAKYADGQGYTHAYCAPGYQPSVCCAMATLWATALRAVIDARHAAWQTLFQQASLAVWSVGHPDPPGCINRLAAATTACNALVTHDSLTRYDFETTYLGTEQQMVAFCGGVGKG